MNKKILTNTVLTLLIGTPVFLGLIPYGIFYFSRLLDNRNGFSHFYTTTGWKIFAVLLMLTGFYFALSSIILMIKNMGIPTSVAPKGHLMTGGVYSLSRNPMAFGTILLYAGFAIYIQSFSAVLIVFVFSMLLVTYIKTVEEKKMEEKFGDQYLEYKKRVSMLFPKFRRK